MQKLTIEEKENKFIDPFKPKETRADLRYEPLCKDLKDVVYTGDLSKKETRDLLDKVLQNYFISEQHEGVKKG